MNELDLYGPMESLWKIGVPPPYEVRMHPKDITSLTEGMLVQRPSLPEIKPFGKITTLQTPFGELKIIESPLMPEGKIWIGRVGDYGE